MPTVLDLTPVCPNLYSMNGGPTQCAVIQIHTLTGSGRHIFVSEEFWGRAIVPLSLMTQLVEFFPLNICKISITSPR